MDKLQTNISAAQLFFTSSTVFKDNNQGHSSHYMLLTWNSTTVITHTLAEYKVHGPRIV